MHTFLIFIQAALSSQANSDPANHSKPSIVDMTMKKQYRTAVNPPSASDKMMPSFGHQSLINSKTNEQISGLSENLQGTYTVNSSVPCMSTGKQSTLEPEKCSISETNVAESEIKQSIIPQSCFINTKDLNDIYCRFIQEFNLDNMFPFESQLPMHLTAPILFPKKKKIETYFKSLSLLFLKSNLAQKQPKVVKVCLEKDKTGSEKAKIDEYGITITKNGGEIVTDFSKLVIFEEPTFFGYYDQEKSIDENIHPMQTVLQFYVPTTIKPKTVIQNSISVLQITPSEDSTNLKTTIGDDNTFVGSTDFNILADGVNIGHKNIFDNFYLGPGVTIGSYNQIKSTIIYAGSKIEDNVKIGENVIIGRGVVIKCHAIIGDGVIIEDGVFIDRCAVIKNDVRVKSRSKIGQNVLLENNVSVGNNTVIMNLSKVTNNVLIERDAFIGYDCKICDNILVDENSVVMDKCSFTGQKKLAGVVTGVSDEEKVLDEKFSDLEVMNSWSNQ